MLDTVTDWQARICPLSKLAQRQARMRGPRNEWQKWLRNPTAGTRSSRTIARPDSRRGEIWLVNANIPEYLQGGRFNHAPKRSRKVLLHRRQINKLAGAVEREGMTLVPLKLYFNEKGRAKIELALARGKKLHDKRETEKKRSWERERGRLLRAKA